MIDAVRTSKRSEACLIEAQKLSRTGSFGWNVSSGELVWSDETFRILECDPATTPSLDVVFSRIHPDDLAWVKQTLDRANTEGTGLDFVHRLLLANGAVKHIHVVARALSDERGGKEFIGAVMDVTEHIRARAALEETLSAIPGLVSTRAATGAPEFINRKMMEFFGSSLEQLSDWSSLIHPEDRERVVSMWRRSIETGQPYDVEHRARRADGVYRWIHARGEPLRDPEGHIVRWWNLITDIDDRKRAEEALSKARADLARATRMTSLGELAASIAHEVNLPLAAVVTNAHACLRWLNRTTPNLDEAREAAQRIVRDGNRGSEVIGRVRALLRKEDPLRTRVNVNEIIREIARLMQVELSGTTVQMELANALPCVPADGVQLQQVLLNLMMNAHDAMKTVSDRPHVLRIETRRFENDSVLVAVQDSGVGFEPGKLEQLFETFYTTKPEGLGLGLSISRSIVESHGGRLWAEGNAGPGALFQFVLPAENGGPA